MKHLQVFSRLALCATLFAAAGCATVSSGGTGAAPRVLIVGGGASHDFPAWFQRGDSTTLAATGARVRYTDDPARVLPELAGVDVLYLSNNQPLEDRSLREAIFNHVRSGKGLMIGHAAAWYNWSDWPEYNRTLVGGGTRAHSRYGEFTVNVVAPNHPIMRNVPASFTVMDELYHFLPDAASPERTVLATAREQATGTVYPIIWTVQSPAGRIVVNTLGHDVAHDHPAYRTILQNSLHWAGGRNP